MGRYVCPECGYIPGEYCPDHGVVPELGPVIPEPKVVGRYRCYPVDPHAQAMRWLRLRRRGFGRRSWWEPGQHVNLSWMRGCWYTSHLGPLGVEGAKTDRRTARALLCAAEVYARGRGSADDS